MGLSPTGSRREPQLTQLGAAGASPECPSEAAPQQQQQELMRAILLQLVETAEYPLHKQGLLLTEPSHALQSMSTQGVQLSHGLADAWMKHAELRAEELALARSTQSDAPWLPDTGPISPAEGSSAVDVDAQAGRRRREAIQLRHAAFYARVERQRRLEMDAQKKAAEEYEALLLHAHEKGLGADFPRGKRLVAHWYSPLKDAIAAEQERMKAGEFQGASPAYKRAVAQLLNAPSGVLAVVTAHKVVELLLTEQGRAALAKADGTATEKHHHQSFVTMLAAANAVGRAVEVEVSNTQYLC